MDSKKGIPRKLQFMSKPEEKGIRLDSYLAKKRELGLSRNYIQILIDKGMVRIRGKKVKASHKISPREIIDIEIPPPEPLDISPEEIQLDIVYEDDEVIVINKPAGIVVHPGSSIKKGTLVNALLYHCKNLSGIGGKERPGIVHRLDKGTSGLLMVAKTDSAHRYLSRELKERTIQREYTALVYGNLKNNKGFIEGNIGRNPKDRKKMSVLQKGGRSAGTHYHVIKRYPGKIAMSLIQCKLTTGRTHQIRVHLSFIGHPVVGDATYGQGIKQGLGKEIKEIIARLNGHALHAGVLGFHHPVNGEYLEFKADLPIAFGELLNSLNSR